MIRSAILTAALAATTWFGFLQERSAAELCLEAGDLLDGRPAHTVLFLGNSRTYYHNMPAMVREIADSAHDPEKYEPVMAAYPGASFHNLAGVDRVRRLAGARWDDVVMQGESRGQSSEILRREFFRGGEALAALWKPARGRPWLLVNWTYDPSLYVNPDAERPPHTAMIRSDHDQLARRADLREIGVSQIWERVRAEHPDIRLTEEGNHPSIAGSYLLGLAIYASLSGRPVDHVTYVPRGLSPEEAGAIRRVVAEMN
jgi:hypothetical protein